MDLTRGRDAQITADDHGPIIDIVAWFLMVTMILAVMFRLMIRLILTRSHGVEDGIICAALVQLTASMHPRDTVSLQTATDCHLHHRCLVLDRSLHFL